MQETSKQYNLYSRLRLQPICQTTVTTALYIKSLQNSYHCMHYVVPIILLMKHLCWVIVRVCHYIQEAYRYLQQEGNKHNIKQ
jgi:hypothetical protein